ncbi:MAG: hypothetical protein F4103_03045 [Boseongicola sp. SB0673_bin_14]|nr:hypothetical protein [Boseongicola sp. SB0667_bin_21]MYI67761.1 hypothetical protein [Boseongicola sp. SB0673_bin_14]
MNAATVRFLDSEAGRRCHAGMEDAAPDFPKALAEVFFRGEGSTREGTAERHMPDMTEDGSAVARMDHGPQAAPDGLFEGSGRFIRDRHAPEGAPPSKSAR